MNVKATCPFCGKVSSTEGSGWIKGCEHADGRLVHGNGPIHPDEKNAVDFYFSKAVITTVKVEGR